MSWSLPDQVQYIFTPQYSCHYILYVVAVESPNPLDVKDEGIEYHVAQIHWHPGLWKVAYLHEL